MISGLVSERIEYFVDTIKSFVKSSASMYIASCMHLYLIDSKQLDLVSCS